MSAASEKRSRLRARLESGELIVAPGVFDMISARIADGQGFDALYMTGYGISASYLGLPDAGFATLTDMAACARRIAEGTETPTDRRRRHRLWRPAQCAAHDPVV